MSYKTLYANIANISNIISVDITESHSSPVAVATITCEDESLQIGDLLSIYLGYTDDYQQIFRGYVRQKELKVPEGVYTITLHDYMCRAADFFVASEDPNKPFSRKNIKAEFLVRDVFALAGLTDYTYEATYLTLAIETKAEVNLISVLDYNKSIADLVTWTLWADQTGKIHFENRKPYVMTGDSGQVGDTVDERPLTQAKLTIDSSLGHIINITKTKDEANLRNKVIVYGSENIHASASSSTSYDPEDGLTKQILPTGFYKTTVAASSLLNNTSVCQDVANYNLTQLNRLTFGLDVTAIGMPSLHARDIIRVIHAPFNINRNFYVYSLEHSWSKNGYTTRMILRV